MDLDFNKEEKKIIKNLIKEKMKDKVILKDLNQRIKFIEKIGFYKDFLYFDINAKEEELKFFFENINLVENDELEPIILNNWFQVLLFDPDFYINFFNMNDYMKLYNLKLILEKINAKLILENF